MIRTGKSYGLLFSAVILHVVSLCIGIDISFIKESGDSLIDLVLSDEFEGLFRRGNGETDGMKLFRLIEANTKLKGPDFEELFYKMLGARSLEELQQTKYDMNKATNVINSLIKLADNISVNQSRKPGSKYKHEDERITAAKKLLKDKLKGSVQFKEEL
ncbi:uncharacterized protein LOC120342277 [Styela clava]|uniref:uncharacterized protein LOC120342277 n=1 Tax=Styela clava TaxID=7725 RepID=UPI00193A6CB2|nr:uncharacterized protein LOC120342277 [Styela clava]